MPHSYFYNPLNRNSRALSPDKLYSGIELEYVVRDYSSFADIAAPLDRAAAKYGLEVAAVWKEDESIPSFAFEGFFEAGELVTMPFERHEVYDVFYDFFNINSMRKVRTNYECGYHIHVSESVLSMEQIFFLRWLCSYKNESFADSFKPLLEYIADRQMYHYCTFVENPCCVSSEAEDYNRREAIAVSCHHKTVEFRAFKAPKSLYDFLRAFEFVHALIDLSEQVQEILDKKFLSQVYNKDSLAEHVALALDKEYAKLNDYVSFDKLLKHLQSGKKYSILKFSLQEYSA